MLSQTIVNRRWLFIAAIVISSGMFLTYPISSLAQDRNMSVIAHASSGPLECEIRKVDAEGSIHLTGVVSSSAALAGNFRFTLTKSGPSGSSNINQGNTFDLAAGAETYVSRVTINLQHDDHAVVELLATSNNGIACHARALLEL